MSVDVIHTFVTRSKTHLYPFLFDHLRSQLRHSFNLNELDGLTQELDYFSVPLYINSQGADVASVQQRHGALAGQPARPHGAARVVIQHPARPVQRHGPPWACARAHLDHVLRCPTR